MSANVPGTTNVASKTPLRDAGYRLLMLVLGCYLLFGGIYSFVTHKWFSGFPPILDVLSVAPGVGSLIEAAIALVIGIIMMVGAVFGRRRSVPVK